VRDLQIIQTSQKLIAATERDDREHTSRRIFKQYNKAVNTKIQTKSTTNYQKFKDSSKNKEKAT
jgi:hypothetical protein